MWPKDDTAVSLLRGGQETTDNRESRGLLSRRRRLSLNDDELIKWNKLVVIALEARSR